MNLWMSEPFDYPPTPMDRGKVLTAEDLDRLGGYARYADVDGDGIGYRSLPGTDHPRSAYLARGTGHNERAVYSERPDDWVNNMARLGRKHDTARELVPQPEVSGTGAPIGLIAYGTTHACVVEARDRLRAEQIETDYLRVRALPFNSVTRDFIEQHSRVYVVENNTDGQMAKLVRMEFPDLAPRVFSLAYSDGLPLTPRWLTAAVLEQER